MAKETVNLSEMNLDNLPQRKAVYAIFASEKDSQKPINCRYVGETDNLEERTKKHLGNSEQNECLKEFMQSDKVKLMTYELLPNSDKQDRFAKENEWIELYKPKCNVL